MPELIYADDKRFLKISFTLVGLETYADDMGEGWLSYSLVLASDSYEITNMQGTIHANDVEHVERMLCEHHRKRVDYEPIEPDFVISVEDFDDESRVTIVADYIRAKDNCYSGAGVGVTIPASKPDVVKFAEEVAGQRLALTKGVEFEDYEQKKVLKDE